MFFDNEAINNLIKNYLDKKFESYGDIKYAYAIMNKKNTTEMRVISNRPDWFEVYVRDRYQHIDPVIITALNRITSFPWDENIMINSDLKLPKIFNIVSTNLQLIEVFSIAKKYNIISGYTFILHDCNNNLAVLSILMDDQTGNMLKEKIEKNKDKLQMLLLNTHDILISLYKETHGAVCKNSESKKEKFSSRENEVLYWFSMGKTYSEIAIIFGIKLGTVKFHMGNIVKKLGVLNAKHAIRLGTESQLINSL
ncbi:DNA-binding HTH domain-containing protein invovled in quorum sensing [Candidatus Regiella insecticola LSR1]|uniref:DNA-binding HTH domain-containing protein invovled in quorum sensing n=1 Tax=Candidatus Regiella insecticola LSR1 TaxID=663321 RepID=E0WRX8_9ENTR|nr:LuxR family transcriptional regulator [Candidatus Regiella insecticola]EFL92112.1 DNA-binding HTH domain-containing protein invovled in quorum sensing [Candidatus Regiella insecticola LSR1]